MLNSDFSYKYRSFIASVSQQLVGGPYENLWWGGYISSKNRFYHANELVLELLKDPKEFQKKKHRFNSLRSRHLVLLRSFYYFLKVSVSIFLARLYERSKLGSFNQEPKNVLVTFSYEKDFETGKYADVFWGNLPEYYDREFVKYFFLTFPLFSTKVFLQKSQNTTNLVSFYAFIGLSDLWCIFKEVFFPKGNVKLKNLQFDDVDVSKEMSEIINYDIRSAAAINSLLLYFACKKLSSLNLRKYLYIYEGNYWERLQIKALKEYSPSTEIIGYQHNIVSCSSFNYFPGKDDVNLSPFPHKVLTTGLVTKNRLIELGDYEGVSVEPACAIRYGNLYHLQRVERTNDKVILVALEGLRQSVEMLNSLLDFAHEIPDWTIRVRTHPIFPFKEAKKYLKHDISKFTNVEVSTTPSLMDDLKSSRIVMYWASTVALESLCLGVPVINFKKASFFDTDPIFDLKFLKEDFLQGVSPKKAIERLDAMSEEEFEKEYREASHYIKGYLTPVSREKLSKFF